MEPSKIPEFCKTWIHLDVPVYFTVSGNFFPNTLFACSCDFHVFLPVSSNFFQFFPRRKYRPLQPQGLHNYGAIETFENFLLLRTKYFHFSLKEEPQRFLG